MSEETTAAEGGLTRREMLKKSALVGAVAWTIPIVGSFNAPAFGQVTSPPCAGDPAVPCKGFDQCGGAGAPCNCLTTVEGDSFCHNSSACSALTVCTSSATCPPGWACVASCCAETLCAPPCGVSAGADDGGPYTTA